MSDVRRPIVQCECGELFDVETRFVGGYANCPRCRKAVAVPGLRDGYWRLLQLGALASVLIVGVLVWNLAGPLLAFATASSLALLIYLLSRAF